MSVRESLDSHFRSVGLRVLLFASAAELLGAKLPDVPSCLVLDVRLPGVSGLDFQTQLARASNSRPIIFMTGHGDIPMSVRAMKTGAADFLAKPFRDQDMLDAVVIAVDKDRKRREAEHQVSQLNALFSTLSPREREIMKHVAAGLMNKQVSAEVGLSGITVKSHRGIVMRKLNTRSLTDLVRMAEILKI